MEGLSVFVEKLGRHVTKKPLRVFGSPVRLHPSPGIAHLLPLRIRWLVLLDLLVAIIARKITYLLVGLSLVDPLH